MKRITAIEIIIFLYAVLFIYTGISKLLDYSTFKEQLSESPILGFTGSMVALTLPWIEFLTVLLLFIPRWRLKGLYVAMTMMIAFTIYIVALLSLSDKLPCSCGGIIAALSWKQHVIFNITFIALAYVGVVLQRKTMRAHQQFENPHFSS